jgi:hypothetical protein
MPDVIRVLNDAGMRRFGAYLKQPLGHPPSELLLDPVFSDPFAHEIEIEARLGGKPFVNRFNFGMYLCDRLSGIDQAVIARHYGLWNWLCLYYFDQLCPPLPGGERNVQATELYLLSPRLSYRQSFRHLARAPWQAVTQHGENARILLIHTDRGNAPLATRGHVFEQLASRQGIFGNQTIIEAAYRLYFDAKSNRPHWGASTERAGAVNRFALVVQQLELTYDLRACSVDQLIALLPKEFNEWKGGPLAA